jgi:phenylalanyl-tRNA synthetase alpha chain
MDQHQSEALAAIEACTNLAALNEVRQRYLSKKGIVASLMSAMKDLAPSERPAYGQAINALKTRIEEALESQAEQLEALVLQQALQEGELDVTLPGSALAFGNLHPLTHVQTEIETFFIGLGYHVVEGPEVELDYYNFERANIPADHPARDMQDTFYINTEWLLRTHTTAIQTRTLEAYNGRIPIQVICPGKVYRKDDDDATHSHQFTQIEGLVVGEQISLLDLKQTLEDLAKTMFGSERTIRFRPSYFQFTEPSVEVDVSCHICGGQGCSTCKHSGWIEILGAGMVHPHVLTMAGFDPTRVSGFAFGVGVERVALLKYGIDDIRQLYVNDLRFLANFKRFE